MKRLANWLQREREANTVAQRETASQQKASAHQSQPIDSDLNAQDIRQPRVIQDTLPITIQQL